MSGAGSLRFQPWPSGVKPSGQRPRNIVTSLPPVATQLFEHQAEEEPVEPVAADESLDLLVTGGARGEGPQDLLRLDGPDAADVGERFRGGDLREDLGPLGGGARREKVVDVG